MNYKEKLLDPRWQKKRLQIFNRDKFRCVKCNDDKSTLHIHHLRYYGEPWDVKNEYLQTLCDKCHDKHHNIESNAPAISAAKNPIVVYFDDVEANTNVPFPVKWDFGQLVKWENAEDDLWKEWNFPFSRSYWIDYLKTCFNNTCFKNGFIVKRDHIVFGRFYYDKKD